MGYDSTIRLRQLNQSEVSGFISQIVSGILANSGTPIAPTGLLIPAFYPKNFNPSGYQQSGAFLSESDLNSALVTENAYIALTYYPNTNPSGYITTGQTGIFTSGSINTGALATVFYPLKTNPSGYFQNSGAFLTAGGMLFGNGSALGLSTDGTNLIFADDNGNQGGFSLTEILNAGMTLTVTGAGLPDNTVNIIGISGFNAFLSGDNLYLWQTPTSGTITGTGLYYPLTGNPSGFVTTGQTGLYTGNFYPRTGNPSKFLSGSLQSDNANHKAIDWNARSLYNNTSGVTIDWQNKDLFGFWEIGADTSNFDMTDASTALLTLENPDGAGQSKIIFTSDGASIGGLRTDFQGNFSYYSSGPQGIQFIPELSPENGNMMEVTTEGVGINLGIVNPSSYQNPQATLDVYGTIGNSYGGSYFIGDGITQDWNGHTHSYVCNGSGNFGIGVNNPQYTLDVTGIIGNSTLGGGVVDLENQYLYANYAPSSPNIAIDWGNRHLVDNTTGITIDWNNKVLQSLGQTSIDWKNYLLYDGNIVNGPVNSVDYANRILIGNSTPDISPTTFTSLDWQKRILSGAWSGSSLSLNKIIGYSGGSTGQGLFIQGGSGTTLGGAIYINPGAGAGGTPAGNIILFTGGFSSSHVGIKNTNPNVDLDVSGNVRVSSNLQCSTLTVSGMNTAIKIVSGNYTFLLTDSTVLFSGANLTGTLPNATANNGLFLNVKQISGSLLITGSQNIDNASTYSSFTLNKGVCFQSDGHQWWIVNHSPTGVLTGSFSTLQVTGNSMVGNVTLSGIGGLNVSTSGQTILFSGGAGGGVVQSGSGSYIFRTSLISGNSSQFISFPAPLDTGSYVIPANPFGGPNMFTVQTSGITSSGYWALFSNPIDGNSYSMDTMASISTATGLATTVIVNNVTGNYYPASSNPSGYITSGQTGSFATLSTLFLIGSGSPTGVVNALIPGQPYTDTGNAALWIAYATGKNNWVQFV